MHVIFLRSVNQGVKNAREITREPRNFYGVRGNPFENVKTRVPGMPFPTFWGRFDRL